jgi:hypothetical protein
MPLAIKTSVFNILSAVDLITATTVLSWQILTEKTLGSSCEGSRASDCAAVQLQSRAKISDARRQIALLDAIAVAAGRNIAMAMTANRRMR